MVFVHHMKHPSKFKDQFIKSITQRCKWFIKFVLHAAVYELTVLAMNCVYMRAFHFTCYMQAGRSTYVAADLQALVPDPGAMAAAAWYRAAALAVKDKLQPSPS